MVIIIMKILRRRKGEKEGTKIDKATSGGAIESKRNGERRKEGSKYST